LPHIENAVWRTPLGKSDAVFYDSAMKTCIIYTRVSTTKQGEDGISLEAQLQKGRDWALSNGRQVIGVFHDVASGSKDSRIGMTEAVDLACKSKCTLVCYSLSRLSRSTIRSIELITKLSKCGAGFVSLTESQLETISPTGEFLVSLYASIATLERRQIANRTKMALRYMLSKGLNIYSKIPYGWDLHGKMLVKNEQEQNVIARIVALRVDGQSLGEIADKLNAEGVQTKQSKKWGRGTIYALLKREMKTEVEAA
jgi:site-specific DNA recombinase